MAQRAESEFTLDTAAELAAGEQRERDPRPQPVVSRLAPAAPELLRLRLARALRPDRRRLRARAALRAPRRAHGPERRARPRARSRCTGKDVVVARRLHRTKTASRAIGTGKLVPSIPIGPHVGRRGRQVRARRRHARPRRRRAPALRRAQLAARRHRLVGDLRLLRGAARARSPATSAAGSTS